MNSIIRASLLAALALPAQARTVSHERLIDYIIRGQVWHPVDVASMDTLQGPQGEGAYKDGQEVDCSYEEKDPNKPIGGHSKKFPCIDAAGVRLKIKYDPKANHEIFGEVAATRLYWALGFYADSMYSVKVVCKNCPEDPFVSSATPRSTRTFALASIQKRLAGEEVGENAGGAKEWWRIGDAEGWTYDQLVLVDEKAGGATKAQTDALTLLAVFVNDGDNTPNQQTVRCLEADTGCKHPALYVKDLGGTFGGPGFFPSFRGWSKKAKIWKDPKRCVADFQGTVPESHDPKIGEAGRKFLADLLGALTEEQIRNIFKGARFDVLNEEESPIVGKDGKSRQPTIDDWVRVFLAKREQIVNAHCPE